MARRHAGTGARGPVTSGVSRLVGDARHEQLGAPSSKRSEPRRPESTAVVATMKTWLWQQAVLKTLSIGHAAAYVVANWDRLTRFLQDARIPLAPRARPATYLRGAAVASSRGEALLPEDMPR